MDNKEAIKVLDELWWKVFNIYERNEYCEAIEAAIRSLQCGIEKPFAKELAEQQERMKWW